MPRRTNPCRISSPPDLRILTHVGEGGVRQRNEAVPAIEAAASPQDGPVPQACASTGAETVASPRSVGRAQAAQASCSCNPRHRLGG